MFGVAKLQVNFRMDDWLKDRLDEYCTQRGLIKERAVEALIYGVVVKDTLDAKVIFDLIQDLAEQASTLSAEEKAKRDAILSQIDRPKRGKRGEVA